MLPQLYEETLRNKESIIKSIEEVKTDAIEVKGWWNNTRLNEDPEAVIGAVDGSMNRKEYKGSVLYAVDAEALIFNGKTLNTTPAGEVGVFPKQPFIENRLKLYMSLYEHKTALSSIKQFNPDLFLLDGSLINELIKSISPLNYMPRKRRKELEDRYLPRIKSTETRKEISVKKFRDVDQTDADPGDIEINPNTYLEYLEYLHTIQELLAYRPIGVSKTSTGTEYFKSNQPDITIFEKQTRLEGYSKPKQVSIDRALKQLPTTHKFFNGLEFTVFYARLKDNETVLKFEIPGGAGEKEIKKILSKLKAISAEGYPYLLKKAHNDVVIKNRDMVKISRMLGITEKTGREIL